MATLYVLYQRDCPACHRLIATMEEHPARLPCEWMETVAGAALPVAVAKTLEKATSVPVIVLFDSKDVCGVLQGAVPAQVLDHFQQGYA